ncbi:VCBS repeat-containing protein [Ideonella sp. DXS29W]|uniref:VCBS repeat-containing protein n=1 Tax=Ideonella lacteola TaxID=2984193 RepID=A0ABU9BUM5_9BURK
MKQTRQSMAAIALFGLTVATVAAEQPEQWRGQGPYLNEAGQPIRDESGRRITYKKGQWLQPQVRRADSHQLTTHSLAGSLVPSWSYVAFGSDIGGQGLVSALIQGKKEILATASTSTFGPSTYWYALAPVSGALVDGLKQTFASPPLEGSIVKLALATGSAGDLRIVVALSNDTLIQYDAATKQVKSEAPGPCAEKDGLTAFTTGDLNADGVDEFISICGDRSLVVDGPAYTSWTLPEIGGDELVLGQMDDDAAIEIVSNSGQVIDSASKSIQWTYENGFGRHMVAGDVDGDGRHELLGAESWYFVNAYDVEKQLPKWTIQIDGDIDAIQLGDVTGDGMQELLVGELQGSAVQVFDTVSQAKLGKLANPEGGVTNLLVTDLNGDGSNEILWGCGETSTGPDFLKVASWSTRKTDWQSIDLVGPFTAPVIGDLDGDGIDEVVFGSYKADSGYSSGRIIVLDGKTLAVRGVSAPIVKNQSWEGTKDLALADVDGDGKKEILVAADRLYQGALEIYQFTRKNTFKKLTTIIEPDLPGFTAVTAADSDGDGTVEMLAGNSGYLYAYDPLLGTRKWRTSTSMVYTPRDIIVGSFDDEVTPEIAAMGAGGNLFIHSGVTHEIEAVIEVAGARSLSSVMTPSGLHLLVGDFYGKVNEYAYRAGAYTRVKRWQASTDSIDGVTATPDGTRWVGSAGIVRAFGKQGTLKYESVNLGFEAGRKVVRMKKLGLDLTNGLSGLYGLPYTAPAANAPQ